MQGPGSTRRDFGLLALTATLGLSVGRPALCRTTPPRLARRIVALDWSAAETLIGLGHPPLAAAETAKYNQSVAVPRMPEPVIDVGLRFSPNFELLQSLNPDLVLMNSAEEPLRAMLTRIAPVSTVSIYSKAGQPYQLACAAAIILADLVGDAPAANRLLADVRHTIAETRLRLKNYDGRPLYLVEIIDKNHVAVAGGKSLFQGVLDQLGLRNAWTGRSNDWGTALINIEALAAEPNARILYFAPYTKAASRIITFNALWRRLPSVQSRRVVALPPVWLFGGLPGAMRMTRLLGEALTSAAAG